jgi:L-histidine Nalpha-methyltransferase
MSDRPSRLDWLCPNDVDPLANDGPNVARGLLGMPKKISAVYVYDEAGNQLFEKQCEQPEYYLTRVEARMIEARAAEILSLTGFAHLVELGAGNAQKTQAFFQAFAAGNKQCVYYPIDVDREVMARALPALIERFPGLTVHAVVGTYELGLEALPPGVPRLFLFLGSTIGGMEKAEYGALLRRIRASMGPADFLLVAADLEKDADIIQRAYNDAAGYGPRSTLNILSHLNWRYLGDFDPGKFAYHSQYKPERQRNEIHIVSRVTQWITLKKLDLRVPFAAGEPIHAEIMWKFNPEALVQEVGALGYEYARRWTDAEFSYGLFLFRGDFT